MAQQQTHTQHTDGHCDSKTELADSVKMLILCKNRGELMPKFFKAQSKAAPLFRS